MASDRCGVTIAVFNSSGTRPTDMEANIVERGSASLVGKVLQKSDGRSFGLQVSEDFEYFRALGTVWYVNEAWSMRTIFVGHDGQRSRCHHQMMIMIDDDNDDDDDDDDDDNDDDDDDDDNDDDDDDEYDYDDDDNDDDDDDDDNDDGDDDDDDDDDDDNKTFTYMLIKAKNKRNISILWQRKINTFDDNRTYPVN